MGRPHIIEKHQDRPGDTLRGAKRSHAGSRLLLLLASIVGTAALVLTWSIALDIIRAENTEREYSTQTRAMMAARQGRDAIPRALEPADRALALMQTRASAITRNARADIEAIEQTLSGIARRGQDGIRALAVTDATGGIAWQSQPGVVGTWLGNADFFMAHRFGRMAPVLSRFSGPGGGGLLVLTQPILGAGGVFNGVALAVLEPLRFAQSLPSTVAPGDAQVALFHSDGTLIARGRNTATAQTTPRLDPALLPDTAPGATGERSLTRRDGTANLATAFGSAQVNGFDLVVLASIEDPQGGITPSRIALVVYGLAGALSCLVIFALLWLFGRLLRTDDDEAQVAVEASPATAPETLVVPAISAPALAIPALAAPALAAPALASPTLAAPTLLRSEVVPPVRDYTPLPVPIPPPANLIEGLPTVAYAARLMPDAEPMVRITAVNSTLRQVTGWETQVFQDVARWQRTIDWGSYPAGLPLLERLAQPLAPGEEPMREAQVEYRLRRPDGTWMWLRETAKVVARHPTHLDVLGCLADVTRERELAAQADSASRVAARGAMAAGLAHELNQPLAVMSLAAENAMEALEEGAAGIPEALNRLRRIATQAERAKVIASQLRSFARLEAAVLEPVSLAAAARGAMGLMSGALREANIEVELRVDPGLAPVRGQPVLVEQVIVNLLQNARDAIITQEAGPRRIIIQGEPGVEAHEMRLLVSDTGGGVPGEALERVFDPFFTTKSATKGTGLGLPLCRSIMLRFGGGIALTNLPSGLGAEAVLTFVRARLPQAESPMATPELTQGV